MLQAIASDVMEIVFPRRKREREKQILGYTNELNGARIRDCLALNKARPYEVLVVRPDGDMLFLDHPGFVRMQDAERFAEQLVKANPHVTFVVYAPLLIFSANIPVVKTDWPIS